MRDRRRLSRLGGRMLWGGVCGGRALKVRALAAAAAGLALAGAAAEPIRNVILCIGDGMGAEQVRAARGFAGAALSFEAFPYQSAAVATDAAGGAVTDSAAAATALATGRKVYNGVVGLAYPGGGEELETLLEFYAKRGKAAGLVTTSYLTDGTPAGFGAHAASRYDQAKIASDYLWRTRPEVLLGGGGCGLTEEDAAAAGYAVATDAASLESLGAAPGGRLAGLFGDGAMPYEADGVGELPRLPAMVAVALERLGRDEDGFFLLVEGGRIDHACHANDLARCVAEVLAFDEAVRTAAEWMEGRGDTLLLVTADHETGGLQVAGDNGPGVLPDVTWGSSWHTGAPVGLYALGLHAEGALGVSDNTQVRAVACTGAPALPSPATALGVERRSGGGVLTHWSVSSGEVCRIEFSPSLAPPAWEACGVTTAAGERVSFALPERFTAGPRGFFRLVTDPPGAP